MIVKQKDKRNKVYIWYIINYIVEEEENKRKSMLVDCCVVRDE